MTIPAARQGDLVATGTPADHGCMLTSTIALGIPEVKINNIDAAVFTSPLRFHKVRVGSSCGPHFQIVNEGSSKVFIAGLPAARIGDEVDTPGGSGRIIMGSPTVLIGG
jgi:uncharacterized Zn-binding protein involved in type VI secretion